MPACIFFSFDRHMLSFCAGPPQKSIVFNVMACMQHIDGKRPTTKAVLTAKAQGPISAHGLNGASLCWSMLANASLTDQ